MPWQVKPDFRLEWNPSPPCPISALIRGVPLYIFSVLSDLTASNRWLAVAEMHLCVAMTLQLFDMKLLDPLPDVVS